MINTFTYIARFRTENYLRGIGYIEKVLGDSIYFDNILHYYLAADDFYSFGYEEDITFAWYLRKICKIKHMYIDGARYRHATAQENPALWVIEAA